MARKRKARREFFELAVMSTSAFEQVTVGVAAVALSEDIYGNAKQALITVVDEPMRYRFDGMAAATVPDTVVDAMDHTRPCVLVVGNYTFTRVAATPGDYEFTNAVELAAGVNGLEDWHAEESAGAVVITSTGAKPEGIGAVIPAILDIGETSTGSATDPGVATVMAAVFNDMNNGDTLQFAGETFTMAATTSVPDNEFDDVDGFVACVDALDDWGAANDGSDNAVITSAEDGEEWNGYNVVLTFFHTTALVDPTAAIGHFLTDGDTISLTRPEEIQRFRAIRTGASDSEVQATYYE